MKDLKTEDFVSREITDYHYHTQLWKGQGVEMGMRKFGPPRSPSEVTHRPLSSPFPSNPLSIPVTLLG